MHHSYLMSSLSILPKSSLTLSVQNSLVTSIPSPDHKKNIPSADLPHNPHLLTDYLFQIYSESTATVFADVPSHLRQGQPRSESSELKISA